MRELRFSDVGKASKIIKKLNLRIDSDFNTDDVQLLGASLTLKLAENYNTAQDDVAEFMAGLLEDEGMTKAEYLKRPFSNVIEDFERLKEDKGFANFISIVKKLTTTSN